MIIPIYKPLGASTHLLAKKAGQIYQAKATHTGTLDPMADGVVVVLAGEDRFKKSKLSVWKKTYKFEILWGVSTDSLDLLGLITEISAINIKCEKVEKVLPKFIGRIDQKLPKFSAKRMDGQSYFDHAKNKKDFIQKSESIKIHSLEIKKTYTITHQQLKDKLQKIKSVQGNFRQEEIIDTWTQTLDKLPTELAISKLVTTTSKKTYVRALVRDIAQELKIPATTYSLTRTHNGEYSIRDCICLI